MQVTRSLPGLTAFPLPLRGRCKWGAKPTQRAEVLRAGGGPAPPRPLTSQRARSTVAELKATSCSQSLSPPPDRWLPVTRTHKPSRVGPLSRPPVRVVTSNGTKGLRAPCSQFQVLNSRRRLCQCPVAWSTQTGHVSPQMRTGPGQTRDAVSMPTTGSVTPELHCQILPTHECGSERGTWVQVAVVLLRIGGILRNASAGAVVLT